MRLSGHMLRPESSGYVFAASPDPDAPPQIEANHLSTERDRGRAIATLRRLRELARRPALTEFIEGETVISAWAKSDDDILDLYRRYGRSAGHAVGSCAMGPDDLDPLDARLCLRGVARLRVCDASIFPEMPAGGPLAPVMAAALRAAEFILADAAKRGAEDAEEDGAEEAADPDAETADGEVAAVVDAAPDDAPDDAPGEKPAPPAPGAQPETETRPAAASTG